MVLFFTYGSFLLITIRSTGLRDDLTFLLEEDLSNINLCSLHCEMRNCEQLLGSLGLFAHRVGSLDELNQALSDHGPESCKGFARVTVKQKPGQQTDVERSNIKVASFSGFFFTEIVTIIILRQQWYCMFSIYTILCSLQRRLFSLSNSSLK